MMLWEGLEENGGGTYSYFLALSLGFQGPSFVSLSAWLGYLMPCYERIHVMMHLYIYIV